MNLLKTLLISSFIAGVSLLSFFLPNNISNGFIIENPKNESAVVVELFTSQGCSSCPAADKVLSKIIDQSEASNIPVYGLSFHVDYWNRLGWKDPYSSREFTQRQYAYARKIKSSNVYTPQMVINGQIEFVGSRENTALHHIKSELSDPNQANLQVKKLSLSGGQLIIEYSSLRPEQTTLLNTALVERELYDDVSRGENRGLRLKHDNVVRKFTSQALSESGVINMEIDSQIDKSKASVILYAQDANSLKILGATKVALKQY